MPQEKSSADRNGVENESPTFGLLVYGKKRDGEAEDQACVL